LMVKRMSQCERQHLDSRQHTIILQQMHWHLQMKAI
jgi:hypothetical protein